MGNDNETNGMDLKTFTDSVAKLGVNVNPKDASPEFIPTRPVPVIACKGELLQVVLESGLNDYTYSFSCIVEKDFDACLIRERWSTEITELSDVADASGTFFDYEPFKNKFIAKLITEGFISVPAVTKALRVDLDRPSFWMSEIKVGNDEHNDKS